MKVNRCGRTYEAGRNPHGPSAPILTHGAGNLSNLARIEVADAFQTNGFGSASDGAPATIPPITTVLV